MSFTGPILLMTLSLFGGVQEKPDQQAVYTVALEETDCAPTRRVRCSYSFVEVASGKEPPAKRRFDVLFYGGADQSPEKDDAISRLDRLFRIKRKPFFTSTEGKRDTIGYKEPLKLRIEGSKYEFTREDGEKVLVDVEKKTRP